MKLSDDEIARGKRALDEWAKIYLALSAVPGEYKPTASVFRGMNDSCDAKDYAEKAAEFFSTNGLDVPVFVVVGPTSTTRCKFEVVSATAGYSVLYRTKRQLADQ
jgi:hypothetical protein